MNSFVSGATITGWLFRTKSCDVAPGVRFSPGTSAIEIDMPRVSFSSSVLDKALREPDERAVGARGGEEANPECRRQVGGDDELRGDATGGAALIESANRPRGVARPARFLEKRDECGGDLGFAWIDDFLRQTSGARRHRTLLGSRTWLI